MEGQLNLHTFVSGPSNNQLFAQLPLNTTADGRIKAIDGTSKLSPTSPWQQEGLFHENCPTLVSRKAETIRTELKDKSVADQLKSQCSLPKMQALQALDDGSLLFTGERSHIVLQHSDTQAKVNYPPVSIDLSALAAPDFDKAPEGNKDYGLSLAYNKENNVIYVAFEDKVFLLDLEALKQHVSTSRIKLQPQSLAELDKPGGFFKPLLRSDGVPSQLIEGSSICSIAFLRHDKDTAYLFASSTAEPKKDTEIPLKMAKLSADGRTALKWQDAPFNKGLQYSRLVEDLSARRNDGLKGDISTLAAGTDSQGDPVLAIHVHHNHPVMVKMPYLESPHADEAVKALSGKGELDCQHMNPDVFSSHVQASPQGTVTPADADPKKFKIYRLRNYNVTTPQEITPNYHSLIVSVSGQIQVNHAPKIWLRNELMLIHKGTLLSLPWQDDVSLNIMAHPLPVDNLDTVSWFKQPKSEWYKVGETLDMESRPEGLIYEEVDPNAKDFRERNQVNIPRFEDKAFSPHSQGGALYCAAYCLTEVNAGEKQP